MLSYCFGHFSLGCEASRACARWCPFPTRPMRMPDGAFANGANSSPSANRIGAILATLGVSDYNPLLRNRGRRLAELRTALGEPLPVNAHHTPVWLPRHIVAVGS